MKRLDREIADVQRDDLGLRPAAGGWRWTKTALVQGAQNPPQVDLVARLLLREAGKSLPPGEDPGMARRAGWGAESGGAFD